MCFGAGIAPQGGPLQSDQVELKSASAVRDDRTGDIASIGPGGIEISDPITQKEFAGWASIGPGGIEIVSMRPPLSSGVLLQSDQVELKSDTYPAAAHCLAGFNRTRWN